MSDTDLAELEPATARRVLYLHSSAGHYGADRQLALMAGGLDRRRYRPLALLPFEGPLADDLRGAGVEVFTGGLAVLRRELMSARGIGELLRARAHQRPGLERLLTSQRIDIVHANTSVMLGFRGPARRAGARTVVHVREIYPPTPVAWPAFRRRLLATDRVLCVSDATQAPLGNASHVRVVHDGLGVAPERAPAVAARMALGLPRDAFVIAVLGRISGWKGQEVLARALAQPALSSIGAVGLIAGDAWPGQPFQASLRELGAELGLGERLRLVGFRDDVDTVYGAADVVVIPSTRPDPLPNSALEAAAAGCCVVAADHGGLAEIVVHDRTGMLVTPGDHVELAQTLARLAATPELREQLGAAAQADVRGRFAPGLLIDRIMAEYDELLAAR